MLANFVIGVVRFERNLLRCQLLEHYQVWIFKNVLSEGLWIAQGHKFGGIVVALSHRDSIPQCPESCQPFWFLPWMCAKR